MLCLPPALLVAQTSSSGRRPGGSRSIAPREASVRPARTRVSPAAHRTISAFDEEAIAADEVVEGEYIEGEIIAEGDAYVEGEYIVEGHPPLGHGSGCASCDGHGCDDCGTVLDTQCESCRIPRRFCICLPRHGWAQADYLLWWGKGMEVPPLVTTSPSGTDRAAAGVLGQPGTSILYGGDEILTRDISGWRLRYGWWFDKLPGWGIEGEYVGVGTLTESFFAQSSGNPILARPFFNARDGIEDAELIAFPDVVTGSMAVDATTRLDGVAVRLRKQLCGSQGCGYSWLCCAPVPTAARWDFTAGWRYWELDDGLEMRERLQMQDSNTPGSFDITDRFETRNQFQGAELGVLWQGRKGLWSLDALMRVGIGNVHQTAWISGSTTIEENGVVSTYNTGVLAQRTNIGTYERDRFTMVPELGLTVGYQMTKRMRATIGYSLIYWGNVLRPGNLIDTDINPNLFAPEVSPFTGPLRPQFQFDDTDYWVQGLNLGAEYRW
ncbi:MAG: hypothetical protein KatS3mg111_3504 [Pirellulaceae bacterium]|nr:MAG: hypothetical protein KatS3mg111_3504 [Pirellulaceae bacterium]